MFASAEVPHLAWTVLQYYYPGNEVINEEPVSVVKNAARDLDDIWFLGYCLSEAKIDEMMSMGYTVTDYSEVQISKYGCNLYHFTK